LFRKPDEIRHAYRDEQVAREYVAQRFREPLGALLHDRQVRAVRRLIATHAPRRILELAPGPARVTLDLVSSLGRNAVALGASLQMLSEARRRLGGAGDAIRFVHGDAFHLPFALSFDLVYSFRLIRHFDATDRAKLYRQLHSVMRPGGLLVFDAVNEVVSAPLRRKRPGAYKHFDALLTPNELTRELDDAGFSVVGLDGVQHRFGLLSKVQVLVAPRSRVLARMALEAIDATGGEPLEWIVTCRRM
jgi:ubiquinone/menaquinone biosynthesis C-methylase UbiE